VELMPSAATTRSASCTAPEASVTATLRGFGILHRSVSQLKRVLSSQPDRPWIHHPAMTTHRVSESCWTPVTGCPSLRALASRSGPASRSTKSPRSVPVRGMPYFS